jgi:hypothetical protein
MYPILFTDSDSLRTELMRSGLILT